jgi:hypothetical protein
MGTTVRPAPVTQAVRPTRVPLALFLAATAFLGLALLKPWSQPARREPGAESPVPTVVRGAVVGPASPDPVAASSASLRPDQIACPPAGPRIVSLDRLGSWTARTWLPATTVAASGRFDPRIVFFPLDSHVIALGVCLWRADAPAGEATVRTTVTAAWRLGDRTAVALPIAPLDASPPLTSDPSVAVLYRPAVGVGRPAQPWPPGRYALELAASDATDAWVGVLVPPRR